MKDLISEYGMFIVETLGTILTLGIIYDVLFGNIFANYIIAFFNGLIGG